MATGEWQVATTTTRCLAVASAARFTALIKELALVLPLPLRRCRRWRRWRLWFIYFY